jgi:hypothetical protein
MGIDKPVIAPELSVSRQLAEVSATTRYLPVAGLSALPRCDVRTAYVGLLTIHDSDLNTTFLASELARSARSNPDAARSHIRKQLQLLLVLVRSVRLIETCRRDFVIMLGTDGPVLGTAWRVAFEREQVIFQNVAPLVLGSPASDKLHAWQMSQYRKLVVLDSDVLVLRSIEDLFDTKEDFVVAHHPYDLVQAQCGIPLRRRAVGALYAIRPNKEDFQGLRKELELYRRNKWHFQHYGEQTCLACYFKNRSRTLPCSYLFDLSNPTTSTCSPGAAPMTCMRKHLQNCVKWSRASMSRFCILTPREQCDGLAGAAVCTLVSHHLQEHCAWTNIASDARAVHYKGRIKPWPVGNRKRNNNWMCQPLETGALRVLSSDGSRPLLALDDDLHWNATQRRCLSVQRGFAVQWAEQKQGFIVARKCCHFETIMSAWWHELLGGARELP